jgi:protein ImuA
VGERLHLVRPAHETDLLWSVEEALRTAPVGLVIAEPDKPLSLTVGRRLQLAAEAGRTTGLMLIREAAGSNAAETRWHCAALAGDGRDSTLHRWSLTKNKRGTTEPWTVNWNGATAAFDLVSAAGERVEPAQTPRSGAVRPDPPVGQR